MLFLMGLFIYRFFWREYCKEDLISKIVWCAIIFLIDVISKFYYSENFIFLSNHQLLLRIHTHTHNLMDTSASMYVHIYMCVCVCIYIYIYIYIHTHTHTHTCIHTNWSIHLSHWNCGITPGFGSWWGLGIAWIFTCSIKIFKKIYRLIFYLGSEFNSLALMLRSKSIICSCSEWVLNISDWPYICKLA